MFCGMLEVNPNPDQVDNYFGMAKTLLPRLETIDGFVDNTRYASFTRPGWFLSLSSWRDEKALVRWSVEAGHHQVMQAARDRVFADYQMHIGEVISDTHVPAGQSLVQQRLDVTQTGRGVAITLLSSTFKEGWAAQVDAVAVARALGFDPEGLSAASWDVFEAVAVPGELIALLKWNTSEAAHDFERSMQRAEAVRLRQIRIVRDYGMFDRREAPQYFADKQPRS